MKSFFIWFVLEYEPIVKLITVMKFMRHLLAFIQARSVCLNCLLSQLKQGGACRIMTKVT